MGLFNRGQGASSLILDEARAFRAYLGDRLVWDGTMDAFVPVPHILVSVAMADPMVSATALTVVPFISASAQVHEPFVSGTATIRPETAILVTASVNAPDVSADALIDVPAISVTAIVLAPTVSEAFDATVEAPYIQVTAGMYSPQVTVDYASTIPIIAAFAELLAPLVTATGTAVVNAPMIAVTGTLLAPIVRGASAVAAPTIVVSANVHAPELRRDAKVTAPLITATATAFVPNVQAINFQPQGMMLTAEFSYQSKTPVKAIPMAALTSVMPYSVVTANDLVQQFPGPVRVAFGATISNYSGDTVKGSVFVNGTMVGAETSIANPAFRVGAVLFGSANATVAQGDLTSLRFAGVNASFSNEVKIAGSGTRVNVYKQDQVAALASRSTDVVLTSSTNGWIEIAGDVLSPGIVMDGNAIVAQFDHPDLLIGAALFMSSAYVVNLRIEKNGVDIATASAGANDGRVHALAHVPVVAGDKISVAVSRPNSGNWTLKAPSSWGIV
ncbi:hypothetical protein [Rhodococcus erythropolis]|uniref:hypothetical protein n=1 Tax=Rhodococcus erythropolis TaxID=1833 RepID=UPI001BE7F11B|nr:hypothetical protein [Rhodococcus erythropolis]MBT2265922.1 hypothetical protein [Rhodococcus erythropolis]